ncbi:MAG: NADH-quinone oxidoreductase subunit A [Acidobacteria bacterium]|nr:NADH-quinone oxidoreductase subunit A [Acidobacteriota bacterium]
MPEQYFQNYIPVLLMLLVIALLAGGMVALSYWLGQHRPTARKLAAYECGMTPTGDARQPFSVKFYLVAMIFILFDVEVMFLFPWAVIFRELQWFGFLEMLLFLLLVLSGFVYIWRKGVLDWTESDTGESAGERPGEPQ